MSMHRVKLTMIEYEGLIVHGMSDKIGSPSQLADAFRQGIAWAQLTDAERAAALKRHKEYQPIARKAMK